MFKNKSKGFYRLHFCLSWLIGYLLLLIVAQAVNVADWNAHVTEYYAENPQLIGRSAIRHCDFLFCKDNEFIFFNESWGVALLGPLIYWFVLVAIEWVRSGYSQKETLSSVQDTAVAPQPQHSAVLSTASKPTSSTPLQVKGSESVDELMALVEGAEEEQKEAAVGLIHITLIMGGERGKQKLEAFRSRMEKSHPDLLKEFPYDAEEEEAPVKTKRPSLLLRNKWFRSSLLFVVFWMVCGAIRGDVDLIMNSRATGTAIGMALGAGLPWAVLIGLPIIILINGRIGENQV